MPGCQRADVRDCVGPVEKSRQTNQDGPRNYREEQLFVAFHKSYSVSQICERNTNYFIYRGEENPDEALQIGPGSVEDKIPNLWSCIRIPKW